MADRFLVLGSLNIDLVTRVSAFPGAGETVPGGDLSRVPGGKGANQAAGLARLGQPVSMAGLVGEDVFGAVLRAGLEEFGVDVSCVGTCPGVGTGVALVILDAGGENRIIVISGANGRLRASWARERVARLEAGDTLLMQLEIPLDAVIAAAEAARERGARVVLNAAPARPLPERLWRCLDLLVVNETEAGVLAGVGRVDRRSAAEVAGKLVALGPCVVVVTLGAQGAVLVGPGGAIFRPAPRVEVVDTTAAGDACVAGLCAGLGHEEDWSRALALGVAAGSCACRRPGAQPSLPDLNDVERLLAG